MRHLLSTVALAPILLMQGRYVRNTIEMLPEPVGNRQGIAGHGRPLRLFIIGDSAAAGVGASSQEQALLGFTLAALVENFEVHYTLQAHTGDTTKDCLSRLRAMDAFEADVVLTSLGVNDVTSGCLEQIFLRRQKQLITILQSRFSARHIILSGLPPVSEFPALPHPLRWYLGAQAKRFDRGVGRLAEQLGLDFIKFEFDGDISKMATDGFHPGPPVYKIWGEEVAKKIRIRFRA